MAYWTQEELKEIFDRIEERHPPFNIKEVLEETRRALIRVGLILDRLEDRLDGKV